MKTSYAILFTVGLCAACHYFSVLVKRYESGIAYGPVVLCIACMGIWIAGFPWDVSVRHKIKAGIARLEVTPQNPAA